MYEQMINEMTQEYSDINRRKELQKLIQKWERTGLLKKLSENTKYYSAFGKKGIIARLLENQAVQTKKQLMEGSLVGDVANFNKIAFPLVRKVFGQLLAHEIVSVQPMSLPSGLLFFLDFKFDRNKNGFTTGGSVYGQMENAPPNNNPQLDAVGAVSASGGFYNLQTGYSKRLFQITGTTAPTYSGVTATSELLNGATVSGYNFTLSNSANTDLGSVFEIRAIRYGELNYDTGKTFRSLSAVHSLTGNTYRGDIDHTMTYATGALVQVFLKTTAGIIDKSWDNTSVTAAHLVGPARTNVSVDNGTNNLGDFESTSAIPEINLSVSSVAVTAQTRRLKSVWTPELAQDLNAYHAMDADVELTTILSEVISTEIDRDILGQLLSGARVKAAWSRMIGRYVSLGQNDVVATVAFGTSPSTANQAFFGTQSEWYNTLGETMNTCSAEIHKRVLRSGANWAICSSEIGAIIQSIQGFKPNAVFDPTEVQFSLGIEKAGTLTNRYTVYIDPYFPHHKMLMGYKGTRFLDAGFVYAPYVPLIVTPTIFHPDDFTPRKGVMHRGATQMVRPEYFASITVCDLHVIGSPASRPAA